MAVQLISNFKKPTKGILQSPHPLLRKVSKKVEVINNSTRQIVQELIDILKEVDKPYKRWLGMAAPQIGYNVRIVAVRENYHKYTLMINPEIIEQKWFLPSITACYSLPGLYLRRTHFYFKMRYMDLKGKTHTIIYKGGKAATLQQEIDHINGVLACD